MISLLVQIQPIELTRSILTGEPLDEPLPPHVQPSYYAAIIAAEAIGNSSTTRVVELDIEHERVSGYAFYDSEGELVRAVLINLEAYLKDGSLISPKSANETDGRPGVHLSLNLSNSLGSGKRKMKVKRLEITYADDETGIKWGGQTYETGDGRVKGELVEYEQNVEDELDIKATEVVLLTFN